MTPESEKSRLQRESRSDQLRTGAIDYFLRMGADKVQAGLFAIIREHNAAIQEAARTSRKGATVTIRMEDLMHLASLADVAIQFLRETEKETIGGSS